MVKVCHMTSAHGRYDVRIVQKECISLVNAGYNVYLIVCDEKQDEEYQGVHIISTNFKPKSRRERFWRAGKKVYDLAVNVDAEIYCFHDPDLLKYAFSLHKKGKKVIFDSHEFYAFQILTREYIPNILRKCIAKGYQLFEQYCLHYVDAVLVPCMIDGKNYFEQKAKRTEYIENVPKLNEFHENVLGFCNNIYNAEGGTHLTGFKTMFTNVINTYARGLNILKEKDVNFTGADVRNGMTAVISIKHPDPRFEGQTKTKLDNQDAAKVVSKVTGDEIVRFFDRNLDTLKSIIGCAEKAAKIRKTEEKAKTNLLTKQKFSFDSNGKLANCESKDASKCEIFIVEGDSAGGSAKTARNRMYQAILPIRGKILNVEKASIDKVLANAEIKTMINAFGCGFSEGYGNDFDITKLRYDKIIIMADADVDGAHISTLLLTLFYRFMPELIYEGHVYIAMPPLYKAMPSKGAEEYLYDDKALEKYRRKHKGPFTLQRYKGLGEMDAEQLWETTLDPDTRLLKQVEIEDARMASEVTEMLMGTEVPPRKAFIYKNAQEAELDV